MRALITNTLLKQLKPHAEPYEVGDTRLNGFLVRIQPTGVMTFYVVYGRAKRKKLGRTDAVSPENARKRAKDVLGDVYHGADPMEAQRRAEAHALGSFIDELY